jgi:hypothetical protein
MPLLTRTSLIAAALTGAAFITSSAEAVTLSVEQAPTRVAAWDGTIMWSRLDPATGRYQLLKSVGGAQATPVAVAQRVGPFDVDLGTGRDGSTTAVYSRGGDLYRLAVATGVEKKLDRISSPTLVERDPTIQRGYIAFIRRDGGRDELRIGKTTGASDGSRLLVKKGSIVSAELGDKHVAYVESVAFSSGVGGEGRVHVRRLASGADRIVYRARSGGANFANVTRPAYIAAPQAFVWARTNMGSGRGNRLVRYTLRGSKLAYDAATVRYNSTSWAGGALGAVYATSETGEETPGACNDGPVSYCQVGFSGPLSFTLKP